MTWTLLAVAAALLALVVLALVSLRLWRRVRALTRTVAAAGETVGGATSALALAQGQGPLGAHGAAASRPPAGRSSDTARS